MKRSDKYAAIHAANFSDTCRETCPLGQHCLPKFGETIDEAIERMNKAAEEVTL